MTPDPPLNIFVLFSILLIPFAIAGLILINAGLIRSRSTAHVLVSSLCAGATAVLVYLAWGVSLQSFAGGPAGLWHMAGREWNVIGAGRLFARSVVFDGSRNSLILLLQLFAVSLAALIPVASGAERWRIAAICFSSAVLAGVTYPLFAHWAWGGGWLSELKFLDEGGAASIQVVGALTAMAVAWILGPRQGKFTAEGIPTAMPGHSAVLVLFGCILALVGWLGLNLSGAALFAGATAGGLILAAVNTVVAAAAGAMSAFATTWIRFGKPDASLTANGWIAGLVSISAAASLVHPASAIIIGLVIGAAVVFAIEVVELRMHVDDPVGAISVHGVGGIWGILALGIFGNIPNDGQFLAQLVGVATLIGFVLPLSYGLNLAINRFVPLRVEPSGERQGMDLFELGAGAYPEFVTHREDFMRR